MDAEMFVDENLELHSPETVKLSSLLCKYEELVLNNNVELC